MVRKGTNYLSFVTEDGKVHKAWLHDINEGVKDLPPHLQKLVKQLDKKEKELEKKGLKVKTFVYNPDTGKPDIELGEEVELDEVWWDKAIAKLNQVSHPKEYGKMVKDYAELMKQNKYKKRPNMAADQVAREYSGVSVREFIKYINTLVAKKVLPQELKAEYEIEEARSPIQKLKDFDKSRTAVGKKAIFKNKGTEFVRMKKKGQMTIMNVPSDEVDQWKKKGYTPIKENWSFKDFVNQIQERKLTDTELKRREEIAKDFSDADFKKRYGDRWKEVKMGVATKMAKNEQDDPCWDGYKQIGMKKKNGKKVPNCVPEEFNTWGELIEKAEYDGRSVNLNNPTKGDSKKYKVYVKNDKGNVVKVEFGDPNMEIKRDDPQNRASFRARHGCDNPGPKWKAKYWSCKFWSAKSVTDLMKG